MRNELGDIFSRKLFIVWYTEAIFIYKEKKLCIKKQKIISVCLCVWVSEKLWEWRAMPPKKKVSNQWYATVRLQLIHEFKKFMIHKNAIRSVVKGSKQFL